MVETIPLSQRRVDIVLVAFFLINLLFVSYFIDTDSLSSPIRHISPTPSGLLAR